MERERESMGAVSILVLMYWVLLFSAGIAEFIEDDKMALLDFVAKFPHFHALNWKESSPVCSNWTGVSCNADKSRVVAVRLPAVGFSGDIPANLSLIHI